MSIVETNVDELMRQAPLTVADYMRVLMGAVDECFGDGYAENHPDLIGALVNAAATDFATAIQAKISEEMIDSIRDIAAELCVGKE